VPISEFGDREPPNIGKGIMPEAAEGDFIGEVF
jgi:hypothetical protein